MTNIWNPFSPFDMFFPSITPKAKNDEITPTSNGGDHTVEPVAIDLSRQIAQAESAAKLADARARLAENNARIIEAQLRIKKAQKEISDAAGGN